MFTYFDSASVAEHPSLQQRCLHTIQIVASIWTLISIALILFNRGIPSSSSVHGRLGILAVGSSLVSLGSTPFYFQFAT